jgi:hypothetical protein
MKLYVQRSTQVTCTEDFRTPSPRTPSLIIPMVCFVLSTVERIYRPISFVSHTSLVCIDAKFALSLDQMLTKCISRHDIHIGLVLLRFGPPSLRRRDAVAYHKSAYFYKPMRTSNGMS